MNIQLTSKRFITIIGTLLLLFVVIRIIIVGQIEKRGFRSVKEDATSIAIAKEKGIQRVTIQSAKNILYANWLEVDTANPSVFILQGDGGNISHWIDTQLLLGKLGYNSFVFNYSGYGNSDGKPTIYGLENDAINAWSKFNKISKSKQKIVLTHSLGGAVFLASVDKYEPQPNKIILHAAYSSVKELGAEFGDLHFSWSWIVPDIWNNVDNILKISSIPTCIVHSKTDEVVPYYMAQKIANNSKAAKLMTIDGYHHNALHQDLDIDLWKQVFNCSLE